MKKLFMLLSVIFFMSVVGGAIAAVMPHYSKPSDYKIGMRYEDAIKSDKPILALFYVDWCGYCMKFMPKYKIISDIYKYNYNVIMLNAEDAANKNLVENVSLSGFPTVYILDPKYDNLVCINNGVYGDLKKFRAELDRYIRIRKLLDSAK